MMSEEVLCHPWRSPYRGILSHIWRRGHIDDGLAPHKNLGSLVKVAGSLKLKRTIFGVMESCTVPPGESLKVDATRGV